MRVAVASRRSTPWVTLGVNYEAQTERTEVVAKRGDADFPLWKVRGPAGGVARGASCRRAALACVSSGRCVGPPCRGSSRCAPRPGAQLIRRVVATPDRGDVRVHRRAPPAPRFYAPQRD
jgi:hypothetical protein